jgi:hypothetical protein
MSEAVNRLCHRAWLKQTIGCLTEATSCPVGVSDVDCTEKQPSERCWTCASATTGRCGASIADAGYRCPTCPWAAWHERPGGSVPARSVMDARAQGDASAFVHVHGSAGHVEPCMAWTLVVEGHMQLLHVATQYPWVVRGIMGSGRGGARGGMEAGV